MKLTVALFITALLAVLCCACRSVRRGEPVRRVAQINSPELEHGRVVFQQHCHRCHPNGEGGLGPSLNDKLAPSFLMKTQVRLGLGTMPAFHNDQVPPEDLRDLTRYLLALRRAPKG